VVELVDTTSLLVGFFAIYIILCIGFLLLSIIIFSYG